jgi:hypothetical protein
MERHAAAPWRVVRDSSGRLAEQAEIKQRIQVNLHQAAAVVVGDHGRLRFRLWFRGGLRLW